jgi:NAD-dependent DNA ligase
LPLVALKNVGRRFGRVLHAAGYTSIAKLKLANADDLAKLPGFGEKRATDVLLQVGVTAQFSKEPSKKSKHTLMDFDA